MKIKLYKEYLNYIKEGSDDYESVDYKVNAFFEELKSQIVKWLEEGGLAAQGCYFTSKESNENFYLSNSPMTKILGFNFIENEDDEEAYEYRVTFTVNTENMESEDSNNDEDSKYNINKVFMKIIQFDSEYKKLGELVDEINVKDIKEDFFIEKIGELKDKSENDDIDDIDLTDDVYLK